MNSAIIAIVGIVWLVFAYRLYGRFIEKRLIRPLDDTQTPAHRKKDGIDFTPTSPFVLFGHHFSSIAGAGPIIGPVIAAHAFGFGPSLVWILLGSVFVGAVHDYTTLMISVRHDGLSIPEITRKAVGNKARVLFQIFVLIALVFINAVFAIAAAKSFIEDGRIVVPAFGLIPLAMGFGWLVNRARLPLAAGTAATLVMLAGLFALGMRYPITLDLEKEAAMQVWIALLMLYGTIAAVLPVWVLLQPRDFIASWILAAGMASGFLGLIITHRPVVAPFMTGLVSESQGPIWPMLFILIACGAVSGFHSLVSSGTTAKQLARERDGKPVAFGGMITEGGLALLALLAVTAGLAFDEGRETAGNLPTLTAYLSKGGGGPIVAFANGFGTFVEPFMGAAGALFGMIMLNAFVLTTLDTSVRLARFISSELFGPALGIFKNRYVATIVPVIASYALAASGSQGSLWPMFGAANQLVAALALFVVTAQFAKQGRPTRYTLVPAVFMLITTCAALLWKGYSHLTAEEPNYTLAVSSLVLLVLGVFVGLQSITVIRRQRLGT